MEVTQNEKDFDKRQVALVREIVRAIKNDLKTAALPEDELEDLTGDIAFSIAAILDGSRKMQIDGEPLIPVLTFAQDVKRKKLIGVVGGSWMHEYAASVTDGVFDESSD